VDLVGDDIPWRVRIAPVLTGRLTTSHQLAKKGAQVRAALVPGAEELLAAYSVGYEGDGGEAVTVLNDHPSGVFVMPKRNITLTLMAKPGVTAPGPAVLENMKLATLSDQKVVEIKYVSPNEIYVISCNTAVKTYYLSKWNGSSLSVIDTVTVPNNASMYALIAHRNSNEYYAIYRDGAVYNPATYLRKYINGAMSGETTIPWQYGSVEGGFEGFKYFDNRLFLSGYSKGENSKIFTVDPVSMIFNPTPVYTKTTVGSWALDSLYAVNNSLYYVRGTDNGAVAQVILAKWDSSTFIDICSANTAIPAGYGVQPETCAVKDDHTLFLTNTAYDIFSPNQVRLDKVEVVDATTWNTTNVFNVGDPVNWRMRITPGDNLGHWRRKVDVAAGTFDLIRFDYATDSEIKTYADLPYGAESGWWKYDDGDVGHLAYTVMPNATDTEIWLITVQ
jgi:hypothetical protein